MSELQSFLDNKETAVCYHHITQNKSALQSSATDSTFLNLEMEEVIKSSNFGDLFLKFFH
jgi:hypothetical protein